jgi:hypothetical protein
VITCITRYPREAKGESTETYLCDECLSAQLSVVPLGRDGYISPHQESHDCEACGEPGRASGTEVTP